MWRQARGGTGVKLMCREVASALGGSQWLKTVDLGPIPHPDPEEAKQGLSSIRQEVNYCALKN